MTDRVRIAACTAPVWLVACLVLGACAVLRGPTADGAKWNLRIQGLTIENRTAAWVSAVQVTVPGTGQFVSCGNIAPGAECANQFPGLEYSGYPLQITWSQAGRIWSTGELRLEPSREIAEAGAAMMEVVIAGPGSAGAELVEAFSSP